jgi:hypothetical protein
VSNKPTKPFTDTVTEMVTRLIDEKTDASRLILSPAVCVTCGAAWLLRRNEPSQFSHIHGCRKSKRYNVRVSVERIGNTRDERDELSRAYRSAVK